MTKETRTLLKAKVKEVVEEAYRNYYLVRNTSVRREPAMTVTMVLESLPSMDRDFTYKPKKRQYLAVWSALEWHRKNGTLSSSVGEGLNGREARCYEPVGMI